MSRILLLVLLASTITTVSFGQDFISIGDQWVFERQVYGSSGSLLTQENHTITVNKDTIINGTSYLKIVASKADKCLLFKETEYLLCDGSKIYRLSPDLQTNHLMIDFEETDRYQLTTVRDYNTIVSEAIIDSFGFENLPSGQNLETQYLHIENNQSYSDDTRYRVYKGAGFFNPGLLFPNIGTGLCDYWFETEVYKCFISGQDTVRFTDTDCFEPQIISSTSRQPDQKVSLYPNPAVNTVILPSNYTLLSMQDASGNALSIQSIDDNIDLSALPAGTYIITLQNQKNQQIVSTKVVKTP